MSSDDSGPGAWAERTSSRREFLARLSAAGLGVAAAGSLGPLESAFAAPRLATPARGGNLRIGYLGNGTSETYNPALANTPIDSLHGFAVFDPLVRSGPYHGYEPGLAVGWQHNKNATVWEIRLRDGVTWHDGKPFTADDVIYTFRTLGKPSHLGHYAGVQLRLRDLKKLSNTLVHVPVVRPIADLRAYFNYFNAAIVVQNGAKDFSKPIGTGPYKLTSFTPGQRSVLAANRDYWDHPRPYPDQVDLISIDDDTARLNSLLSGQTDICGLLNFAQGRAGLKDKRYRTNVGYGGFGACFNMRVDKAPFTDVRVRQAMKYLANRPALIQTALSGFGDVLNDIPGKGYPHYNSSLPQRHQDIAKAKSLLKAAGQSDIQFTLQTTDAGLGQLQAAEAFIQQCKSAGISGAQLKVEPVSSYYNPAILFTKMTFAQNIWAISSLNAFYSQALTRGAPLGETHWHSASFDRLYYAAQGETNPAKAQRLWNQVQKIQHDQGGYIFWAEVHGVDAVSHKVVGLGGPGVGWAYPTGDQRIWDWAFSS